MKARIESCSCGCDRLVLYVNDIEITDDAGAVPDLVDPTIQEIVTACNAHDKLVEALTGLLELVDFNFAADTPESIQTESEYLAARAVLEAVEK